MWLVILPVLLANSAAGNSHADNRPITLITLQFIDIEITELLQTLAKLGKTNLLLSESIQGKISVDLNYSLTNSAALHSGQLRLTHCP
ncbi:hypothetical protein [Polynucleobacter necessarius]|uniref:hypothetical protein n=1 Tax=Polynucleobacter necessarius TaxID=576610 RepID=UPI0018D4E946|nr:hypothetical protein [Polynucleobacter necessarius]